MNNNIDPKAVKIGQCAEKAADKTIKATKTAADWLKTRLSVAADKLDRKVNKDKYIGETCHLKQK